MRLCHPYIIDTIVIIPTFLFISGKIFVLLLIIIPLHFFDIFFYFYTYNLLCLETSSFLFCSVAQKCHVVHYVPPRTVVGNARREQ